MRIDIREQAQSSLIHCECMSHKSTVLSLFRGKHFKPPQHMSMFCCPLQFFLLCAAWWTLTKRWTTQQTVKGWMESIFSCMEEQRSHWGLFYVENNIFALLFYRYLKQRLSTRPHIIDLTGWRTHEMHLDTDRHVFLFLLRACPFLKNFQ